MGRTKGGVILGEFIGRYLNDWIADWRIRKNHGVFEPEMRLWCALYGLKYSAVSDNLR